MAKKTAKNIEKLELSTELLISMYKDMCLFRRFEERVGQAYTKQKFSGFCHLHIGQEGLAVGIQAALMPHDQMISGYRSHTQAIGKGISPKSVMAELFGKSTGCSHGKGGSMHMFSAEHHFFGGHGIVGGQVPIAAGIAFANRYRNSDAICVCYLGDAATNQGAFHEGLNMAATWDLPVLYVIENNKYGMGTDIRRTTSIEDLSQRALAYDMSHSQVDGMDCLQVYAEAKKCVDKMRKDKKPHLLEAKTYRYRGHSVSDPATYRTKEEVLDYQNNRDPITQMAAYLQKKGIATEEDLKDWDKQAKAQAKEAEAYADQQPEPELREALTNVLFD